MVPFREYEMELSRVFLPGVTETGRFPLFAVTDPTLHPPTFSSNLNGVAPAVVAQRLAEKGIGVRDGHMYAPRVIRRIGLPMESGAIRASLVHYNTVEEIHRFVAALEGIR